MVQCQVVIIRLRRRKEALQGRFSKNVQFDVSLMRSGFLLLGALKFPTM